MTSGLCNPKYYREAFLEIRNSMEVQEEAASYVLLIGLHHQFLFAPLLFFPTHLSSIGN